MSAETAVNTNPTTTPDDIAEQDTLVMGPVDPAAPEDPATLVMDQPGPTSPGEEPTQVMNQPGQTPPAASDDAASVSDEDLGRKLRLNVVDTSHGVVTKAGDYADAHIAEQTTQGGVKGFLKRIWHGNIARDFIHLRREQKGREEIVRTGNINVLQDGTQADHNREMAAVVTRFTNDFLHGENKGDLSNTGAGEDLERNLRSLVDSYATGAIDEAALNQEKTRVLDNYKAILHREDRNKGLLLADNVLEVAQAAKAALTHGIGMDRIQSALTASYGEARIGQRTQVRPDLANKIVDKLYSTRPGSLVNETTLAVLAGGAMAVAKLTTKKAATAAAAMLTMGFGTGVIAGAREYVHIGRERQQHIREMAVGEQMPGDNAKRREQLEETRYNTIAATDLTDQLARAREMVNASDPASINSALQAISEAEARIRLGDDESVDIIDYPSNTSLERGRLQLDMTLAEAKVAARHALEGADEQALQDAGLTRDLDATLASRLAQVREYLTGDISAKDAAFSDLRTNRTIKMGLVGFVTGETIGLGVQELRASVTDHLQGLFTSNDGHVDRQTLLSGLLTDQGANQHNGPGSNILHVHEAALGKNASLDLPPNLHVKEISPGHWNVVGADGNPIVNGLTLDAHGHLTEAGQQALQNAGFHLNETQQPYTTHHLQKDTFHRSPQEFLHHHPGQFTKVDRALWYDNNTPNIFDKNELKLWWGGANNTGLDEHGNYVFNVSQMVPGGSYHDGLSANAQQLVHEGKMAMALSMTIGTQSHVVMIPFDTHGDAIIKANSWMGHSMFEKQNGHANFIGAYAEAVQLMGKHNGVESIRMLATEVGTNNPKHITDVVHHLITHHHERIITHLTGPGGHGNQPLPTEVPVPLPIYGRRGLESLQQTDRERADYFGYRAEPTSEQLRRWHDDLSPRLRDNPDAVLSPEEELSWYRTHLEEQRGPGYLDEIDDYISNDEVLSSIDESTDAIVSIPVAAVNEADNIYDTLSLYNQQSEDAKRRTVILMNVNWKQSAEADADSMAAIQKTISEIERAKAEFPDLKIASFQKQWSDELLSERNGVIYGEVVKVLYDTAMLSMERAIRDGRHSDKEALIISNDADAAGLRKTYLDNYLKAINDYPDSDAYTGLIRFDTKTHGDYPGFGISTNIMMLFSMASGRIGKGYTASPGTPGANSAFRMSSFAAIGGCDDSPDVGAGADTIIGRKLRRARSGAGARAEISSGVAYGSASPTIASITSGDDSDAPINDRAVVKHLIGAQLDTNGDRFLGVYRQGRLVESSWRDYDEGGYRDRREELKGLADGETEDPVNDIDSIASRIEKEISFLGTDWHPQPGLVSWTLGTYFGTQDNKGNPLYTMVWNKGELEFKFTDSGKVWLKNSLTRDIRGRFDPYGSRVRRRLYGELPPGSARAVPPGTRFVGAQTG